MTNSGIVVERDEAGRVSRIPWTIRPPATRVRHANTNGTLMASLSASFLRWDFADAGWSLIHFLCDFFLPAGYPASVTPDYLHYQIYNSLQAFCSSLSGLLASRGALEGVGVGDASTTANYALLVTVMKDTFSRLTTILGAYYFGTSLYPETKTFRFLADIFNDSATVIETFVPFIGSIDLPRYWSILPSGAALQVIALCLSGGLRALCGLVAGGSKMSLINHFASPPCGKGDVGEVSAKDASRETVVGLLGMLLGTLFIPLVSTRIMTYSVLLILVASHMSFNYRAVHSVVLRRLNRQRTCILWTSFKSPNGALHASTLNPVNVASKEVLIVAANSIRDASTGRRIGRCILGASFRSITSRCTMEHVASTLRLFEGERYVLFIARGSYHGLRPVTTWVCFKDGYCSMDQLQAWVHAIEVARRLYHLGDNADLDDVLYSTLLAVRDALPRFVRALGVAGWEIDDETMMFGSPSYLITEIEKDPEDIPLEETRKSYPLVQM